MSGNFRNGPSPNNPNNPNSLNININDYSIEQLYSLFKLSPETATESALKDAKRKVLSLHPDKAGSQYQQHFIFYMNALNRVAEHSEIHNRDETSRKKMQSGMETGFHYENDARNMYKDANYTNNIKQMAQTMTKTGEFNRNFNEAYDKFVKKPIDHSRYQWFNQETPVYETGKPASAKDIAQNIDAVRAQQQQYQLAIHRGVQELNGSSSVGAHGLYDDDEMIRGSTYVSSNPFSKLKYDDLRKVHKDETVFTVSEQDYSNMPKYRNVNEYTAKARPDNYENVPLTRQQTDEQERIRQYETIKQQRMRQMELDAYNNASRYEDLNNKFMSNLLRLK